MEIASFLSGKPHRPMRSNSPKMGCAVRVPQQNYFLRARNHFGVVRLPSECAATGFRYQAHEDWHRRGTTESRRRMDEAFRYVDRPFAFIFRYVRLRTFS